MTVGALSPSTCLACPPSKYNETSSNLSQCAPVSMVIPGLESLGKVNVIATETFDPPNTSKTETVALRGEFSEVTITFPPGAWPSNISQGPSITVFEIPTAQRRGAPVVAGKGVNFGPEGIEFPVHVTISCPVDSGFNATGRLLRVQKYSPQTNTTAAAWSPTGGLKYPDDGASPPGWKRDSVGKLKAISALTTSFSPYAVVDLTSAGTPAPNTTPQSTPRTSNPAKIVILEDSKSEFSRGWIIGLSIFGAVLLIAAFADLLLQFTRQSKEPLLPPGATSNALNSHQDVESQDDRQEPQLDGSILNTARPPHPRSALMEPTFTPAPFLSGDAMASGWALRSPVSGDDPEVKYPYPGDDPVLKYPYPFSGDHQEAGSASDVAVSVSGELVMADVAVSVSREGSHRSL